MSYPTIGELNLVIERAKWNAFILKSTFPQKKLNLICSGTSGLLLAYETRNQLKKLSIVSEITQIRKSGDISKFGTMISSSQAFMNFQDYKGIFVDDFISQGGTLKHVLLTVSRRNQWKEESEHITVDLLLAPGFERLDESGRFEVEEEVKELFYKIKYYI